MVPPHNGSTGQGQREQRVRRVRTVAEETLPQTVLAALELEEMEEEPFVFHSGPARASLSSPPASAGRRQPAQQPQARRTHSFQVDHADVTSGSVPFMRVGPDSSAGPNQFLSTITRGPAATVSALMMNTADLQQQAQQYYANTSIMAPPPAPRVRQPTVQATASPLRNKIVYELHCCYCQTHICGRAMRAILLADTKVELFSTDVPPSRLRLLDDDRMTQGCNCRIRDTACACWYAAGARGCAHGVLVGTCSGTT